MYPITFEAELEIRLVLPCNNFAHFQQIPTNPKFEKIFEVSEVNLLKVWALKGQLLNLITLLYLLD